MRPGEEEISELINAVIDGQATPDEHNRLQQLLATSPWAREHFASTGAIARRLEAMSVAEPPVSLRRTILDSVTSSPTVVPFVQRGSRRRVWFAAGWAAAAALVLVVLITGRSQLTGTGATMAPPGAFQWPVISRISSPRATLIVRREGRLYSIEPVVSGPRPLKLVLGWDDARLAFVGISDGEGASLGKASVSFTLRDPTQRAGVIFRSRGSGEAAAFRVSVGNEEVMRAVIPLE